MTRLHRLALLAAVVVASIWTSSGAEAQEQARPASKSAHADSASVSDSVSVADVQKAAAQLAIAVQEAVRKATEDPAVKVAALKVAKNAVTAAQVVVTQQAETLQAVLDTLAKEIASVAEKQQTKAKSH